jgi:hypothetical protein
MVTCCRRLGLRLQLLLPLGILDLWQLLLHGLCQRLQLHLATQQQQRQQQQCRGLAAAQVQMAAGISTMCWQQ